MVLNVHTKKPPESEIVTVAKNKQKKNRILYRKPNSMQNTQYFIHPTARSHSVHYAVALEFSNPRTAENVDVSSCLVLQGTSLWLVSNETRFKYYSRVIYIYKRIPADQLTTSNQTVLQTSLQQMDRNQNMRQ